MKRRILSLVTVLALVMTMVSVASVAFADFIAYSKCPNGKPLNVRTGPGKEYSVMGKIAYGDQFWVKNTMRDDGWTEIYYGDSIGYVQNGLWSRNYPGQYVAQTAQTTTASTSSSETDYNSLYASAKIVSPYTVTLKASQNSNGVANVRWAPNKNATLLKKYQPGEQVTVLATLGSNWYQIYDEEAGISGFVNSAYVEK